MKRSRITTITIQTGRGPKFVSAEYVPTTQRVLAVNGEHERWHVTHTPSGMRLPGRFARKADALAAARRLWSDLGSALQAKWRYFAIDDPGELARITPREIVIRFHRCSQGRSDMVFRQPETAVPVCVHNERTGESRIIELTSRDVIDGDVCCGPCECQIEPDGVCPHGWPARNEVIGTLA